MASARVAVAHAVEIDVVADETSKLAQLLGAEPIQVVLGASLGEQRDDLTDLSFAQPASAHRSIDRPRATHASDLERATRHADDDRENRATLAAALERLARSFFDLRHADLERFGEHLRCIERFRAEPRLVRIELGVAEQIEAAKLVIAPTAGTSLVLRLFRERASAGSGLHGDQAYETSK